MDYADAGSSYVKSFFGDGLFTSPTEHPYDPGLDVTINPLTTNLEQNASSSFNESRKYDDEVIPTQAPHVDPNGNLGYYIGGGTLAAVFSVFCGAAVYHCWKAKKPKRNKAYDAVMYKRAPDGSQVATIPAPQL